MEADATYLPWLHLLDLAVLTIPGALVVSNFIGFSRERVGKLVYLLSVCVLYTGFILSLSFGWVRGVVVFAAAGSMFHAVEYLAVVSHYARRREHQSGCYERRRDK